MAISVNEDGSFKNLGIEFDDTWKINGVDLVYDDSVAYVGQYPINYSGYNTRFNAARAIEFPKPISTYRLLIHYAEVISQNTSSSIAYESMTSDNKRIGYDVYYCNPKILYEYLWVIKAGGNPNVNGVCRALGGLLFQTLGITGDITSIKILGPTPENGAYMSGDSTTKYWNHSKIFAIY